MSKWFEPLALSPPSDTVTPAVQHLGEFAVGEEALHVLERGGGTVRDLHVAAREQRDVVVVHVHHVGELGARSEHAPVRRA